MYKGNKIGVVVPAYNEEPIIVETLIGIPKFVDKIFVINDASTDNTLELVRTRQRIDDRIEIINHDTNIGLGGSLIDGYTESVSSDVDITAVMAGDNQMHSDDLVLLLDKLIDLNYDYVKGNRLLHRDLNHMPRHRFFGNALLTILTKFATGYYRLMDPQCGYTAIKNSVLKNVPIEKMTKGYGYNADILCMLNIRGFRVTDVIVRPIYGKEKSDIKLWQYVPHIGLLLMRLFLRRSWQRYVILDFHPLILFYIFAFFNLFLLVIPFTLRFFILYAKLGIVPRTTLIILVFTILISFLSVLFAIWMDMDYNKE